MVSTARGAVVSLALLALAAGTGCRQAQARRGWECIAPVAPGGGWDLTCRSLAQVLSDGNFTDQALRVVNMPGAGGGVAYAHAVADRVGDEAVLVAASPSTVLRLAQRQYGELSEDDVRWVAALGAEYGVLAVSQDAPWHTLPELIEAWRRSPQSIIVSGGSAVAGQDHMKVLLLVARAGIDPRQIRYVGFDGGGEAKTALLGGFVHVFSGEASEVEAQLEAGQLRVLTVMAPERLGGALANVPTARESGFDVEWITWRGFYAPNTIPEAAYRRWVDLLTRVGRSPEWERVRVSYGMQPFFRAGDEFETEVRTQIGELRQLSREVGLVQ